MKFCYNMSFTLPKNPKSVDPSYMTGLITEECMYGTIFSILKLTDLRNCEFFGFFLQIFINFTHNCTDISKPVSNGRKYISELLQIRICKQLRYQSRK